MSTLGKLNPLPLMLEMGNHLLSDQAIEEFDCAVRTVEPVLQEKTEQPA